MSNNDSNRISLLIALAGIGFSLWGLSVGFFTFAVRDDLKEIEEQVSAGILPRADERLRAVERQLAQIEDLMRQHLREDH